MKKQPLFIVTFFVCLQLSINAWSAITDWFVVLNGTNEFYASTEVPVAAVNVLKKYQSEGEKIRSFSFTSTGGWIVCGETNFEASDAKVPGQKNLGESYKNGSIKEFNCQAMTRSRAYINSYQHGHWSSGGNPERACKKLDEMEKSGHKVRSLAYGREDCWVALYDKTGVAYEGIPQALATILDEAVSNTIPIKCVTFSGDDWICLAADQWWTSDTNLPVAKILCDEYAQGKHPRWVAFVPIDAAFNANRPHLIEKTFVKRVHVDYESSMTSPETKNGFVDWYALVPPDTEMQKNLACHIYCRELPDLPQIVGIGDLNDSSRFYKKIRIPVTDGLLSQPIHVVIAYDLELYKVRLCTGTSPADSKDKRSAPTIYDIKPTHCLDYTNADFQKYLSDFRLRRGGNESNLAFAHRAFQIFCADMASRFQEGASAAGLGGLVSKLCQRDMHAGGCGDCAFQFVAILRANGVPARVVTGRWAETATPDFGMFHVRSDFYDPSIGWIPVDSNFGFADLLKGRDNECQFEKSAMGDFVTMHLNTDVHPAGTSFEAPAHQFGIVEYIGKDPFHPKYGHETWTVKKIY